MTEPARLQAMYAEYDSAKKSPVVAWILWIFTGGIGGHRYYLGDIGYAIAMTLLGWATFGIWWLIEAFFINRRIRAKNRALYNHLAQRYGVPLQHQPYSY